MNSFDIETFLVFRGFKNSFNAIYIIGSKTWTQYLGKDPIFRFRPNSSSLKSRQDPICW